MSASCTARDRPHSSHHIATSVAGRTIAGQDGALGLTNKVLRGLSLWHDRWQHRRQIAELSPEALADMGITKGEAQREAAKPFWQA